MIQTQLADEASEIGGVVMDLAGCTDSKDEIDRLV